MTLQCSWIETAQGRLHFARCGQGFPVLLLHQTPRSWDEYRDVLPRLGRHFDGLAMDTVGYGLSPPFADGLPTVERWASAALALLDALGLERVAVVGHHTGAVIAMEMAATAPQRVAALVLSSCPMVDAERRARHGDHAVVDQVTRKADGSHLLELWRMRQPFYPDDDIDLMERFMVDALRVGERAAQGHLCVNRYRMEDRIGRVTCPTLLVGATEDPHAYPAVPRLQQAIATSRVVAIEGGRVPLPDQMPEAFSAAVQNFLDGLQLCPTPNEPKETLDAT